MTAVFKGIGEKRVELRGEKVKSKNRRELSANDRSGETDRTKLIPLFYSPFGTLALSFLLLFSLLLHFTMSATEEPRVKPTKPDEAAYKASLAEAEKEHTAAQEKLV
jgi:hypothetical protein